MENPLRSNWRNAQLLSHLTFPNERERKITFCSFSFHSFLCNKKIEIKRERNVCRLQKSYLWARAPYLRSSANFSLLKIQFFDITFTAYGIGMKSGAHIWRRNLLHDASIAEKLFFILFYFIYLWHLHMAKLFAILLSQFL